MKFYCDTRSPEHNVTWRQECRERALDDKPFRDAFWQACMEDPVWFFNSCLWVYEPRATVKTKPFLTWPHQIPVIEAMEETLDEAMRDELPISLTVKKSRAQGGTYLYLGVLIRRALKEKEFAAGLVTRNESLVDSRTDTDAVMYKLAWMLDLLPKWMLPEGYKRNLTEHTIALPNGSVFSGYSATGDVARGGRKTVFAFDEPGSEEFVQGEKDYKIMSSVGSVTYCTFLVSTFGLDSGVFYESASDPENMRVRVLDWKDNPVHAKNAYVIREGAAKAVRPEDQKAVDEYVSSHAKEIRRIERRGHKIDGKVRSPWYDAHCLLPGGTPRFIARELDMDPRGAVGKLFDLGMLDRVKEKDCKPPIWRGTPVFDSETLELKGLLSRDDGPLELWFKPGLDKSAPLGPFTFGCDIAVGSDGAYSSNSVACIIDDRTGEQVGQYTKRGMPSILFAQNVLGLCKWLRNALLGWEDSGVSGPFAKEVLEIQCYGNVYYREVAEIGSRKKTRKAGWANTKDADKALLFERMALAMEMGEFIVRSEDLVRECGEYEWDKGKIVHRPTKSLAGNEKAHGDRCLVAGTMILTDEGEVPIESVSVGDLVWTREGLRPVQCCGKTGTEEVFRVRLSNGRTLIGTGNHPVWTENRAWVPLLSLSGSDILLACPHHQEQSEAEYTSAAKVPKRSSSTGGSTTGIQTPSKGIEGSIFGAGENAAINGKSPFTLPYGNTITAQSRKGTSSTTRTKTRSIMTCRTSSASRHRIMGSPTATANTSGRTATQTGMPTGASTAGVNTEPSGSTARNSVALSAGQSTALKCGHASPAGKSTAQKKEAPQGHALSNAESACVMQIEKLSRPAVVYNLSVSNVPEYFAQGVLVHNCIAAGVAYLVYSEDSRADKIDTNEETGQTPEYGSYLWRERQERQKTNAGTPAFGIRDVVRF